MPKAASPAPHSALRNLPSMERILTSGAFAEVIGEFGRDRVRDAATAHLAVLRQGCEEYDRLEATEGLDLDISFHNNRSLDAYLILRDLYHSRGSPMNISRYKNPEVDELLDQIEIEMSTYVRDGLLEESAVPP